jgi:hypothetical protein
MAAPVTVDTTMRNPVFYAVRVEGLQAGHNLELSELWDSNDVSTEAEEYPLLRFVIRKRLVKGDREDLAFAVVICKLVELAMAL